MECPVPPIVQVHAILEAVEPVLPFSPLRQRAVPWPLRLLCAGCRCEGGLAGKSAEREAPRAPSSLTPMWTLTTIAENQAVNPIGSFTMELASARPTRSGGTPSRFTG